MGTVFNAEKYFLLNLKERADASLDFVDFVSLTTKYFVNIFEKKNKTKTIFSKHNLKFLNYSFFENLKFTNSKNFLKKISNVESNQTTINEVGYFVINHSNTIFLINNYKFDKNYKKTPLDEENLSQLIWKTKKLVEEYEKNSLCKNNIEILLRSIFTENLFFCFVINTKTQKECLIVKNLTNKTTQYSQHVEETIVVETENCKTPKNKIPNIFYACVNYVNETNNNKNQYARDLFIDIEREKISLNSLDYDIVVKTVFKSNKPHLNNFEFDIFNLKNVNMINIDVDMKKFFTTAKIVFKEQNCNYVLMNISGEDCFININYLTKDSEVTQISNLYGPAIIHAKYRKTAEQKFYCNFKVFFCLFNKITEEKKYFEKLPNIIGRKRLIKTFLKYFS